ncbi:MAG: oligosaccharide flippase family protein [Oscillospiraceae bacterium]|nr:oligosaccharide flippase family protein [Oscillospiraceae bacterium]
MINDNNFIKSTAVLGLSGIVVKILSAAYRIPLTRMIGAEGMGQYSAAFNVFMPFFSLATAGITPTISRLCARGVSKADIVVIKRKAGACFGVVSVIMVAVALVISYLYAGYTESYFLFTGVMLLCPNIIFAASEAVYKGISQGSMEMNTSAKAAVLESISKTIIGICSVYLAGILIREKRGEAQLICAFSTVSVSGFICWLYMWNNFRKSYDIHSKSNMPVTTRHLFSMAVPISLSALVVSVSNFCDTVICLSIVKSIPDNTLMAAFPFISFTTVSEKAIWLFGVYQGLCLSVVNLIPSLSSVIGASGLPVITRAVSAGNTEQLRRKTDRLIKLTALCVVPVSLFVMFFSQDVLVTLYGDNGAQTALAAFFLKIMAPVAILSAFSFPLNSIMHAKGKSAVIFRILLFSCFIRVAVATGLCSVGRINIMGCIIAQIVFHTMVFIFSVRAVADVYPAGRLILRISYPVVISYILLTLIRIVTDFMLYSVPCVFRTFFCGMVFVLMYMAVMFFTSTLIDKR